MCLINELAQYNKVKTQYNKVKMHELNIKIFTHYNKVKPVQKMQYINKNLHLVQLARYNKEKQQCA